MTQETINKLHKYENQRDKWIKFRDELMMHQNISIANTSYTPVSISIIMGRSIEGVNDLLPLVLTFANDKIKYYDAKIKEL